MVSPAPTVFDPTRLPAPKQDSTLYSDDERSLSRIADRLHSTIATLTARLDTARRAPARAGRQAVDRDEEIHGLQTRLRRLRRVRVDACLGRIDFVDGGEPLFVGRVGVTDADGHALLVDWRTPAAEPFFAATPADPMGVARRRRYRWTHDRITDFWDEVLTPGSTTLPVALDGDSAFLAELGASRSPRMRDVLGTIAADQDTIIRAGSRGALVVDGGPGTGKTVVALHRAAYLLYADPRLAGNRGGLLVVGPHEPYLGYVSDVLPSLGEDSVRVCTLRDLVPEGAAALDEDPEVARLKASARLLEAVETGVRWYEKPPSESLTVETSWQDVVLTPRDWARAFEAPEPGAPHNSARTSVWEELVEIITERHPADVPQSELREELANNDSLVSAVRRGWPMLEPTDLVADLWSVPAFLRMCAPWLSAEEVHCLQRGDPYAWTGADLPFLDAARHRLGDPLTEQRRLRRTRDLAAQRARMDQVVEELIDAHTYDDGEGLATMLRSEDLRESLVDDAEAYAAQADPWAGPFAHVIVDEAQELTDAQWQMLRSRCPSGSVTVVGDRAQARHGFVESWEERLERNGFVEPTVTSLTINYRTPEEIMAAAAPVIRAVLPDANVPNSIRRSGIEVSYGEVSTLRGVVDDWLADNTEGTACVIGDPTFTERARVRSLDPVSVKGLEFDLVVLVDPASFGDGVTGAVDRYVAMTRATRQLVVLGRG